MPVQAEHIEAGVSIVTKLVDNFLDAYKESKRLDFALKELSVKSKLASQGHENEKLKLKLEHKQNMQKLHIQREFILQAFENISLSQDKIRTELKYLRKERSKILDVILSVEYPAELRKDLIELFNTCCKTSLGHMMISYEACKPQIATLIAKQNLLENNTAKMLD